MVLGPFEERGSKRRFGNSGEECRHEVCIFPPVKFVPPVVLRKKSFCYVKPLYVQGNGRLEPLRALFIRSMRRANANCPLTLTNNVLRRGK
ncbi:OLC1v1028533C3 [Oldenlandia corymbosa var. corymbosa]|uniref:OLC1v1028533C3 n=1 Tax=Oldenlandia corymbosa var. corymbosa TaxID=529605 RepID=A0AAV1CEL2_OLDCO|nr:OLC1v1028533C3 [Oldenlandia corymbosa var. corymbosa]